jgi:hypothetical protein
MKAVTLAKAAMLPVTGITVPIKEVNMKLFISLMMFGLLMVFAVDSNATYIEHEGCDIGGSHGGKEPRRADGFPTKEEPAKVLHHTRRGKEITMAVPIDESEFGDLALGLLPKPLEEGVEVSMNPIDKKKFEEAVKKWWEDEDNRAMGTPPEEWGGKLAMGAPIDHRYQPEEFNFIEVWRNSFENKPTLPHPPIEGASSSLEREISMGSSAPAYFDRDNPGRKIIEPIPDPLCPKGNICIQPLV